MSTMSSAVRGTRSSRPKVFLGESEVRAPASPGRGEWVERDGERYFKIANYHAMPPFLMTVVSAYDHWLFVSSTGGLTCGRRNPDIALFPYVTDDKIHDAAATTGPRTALLVEQDGKTWLWQPFDAASGVYDVERNLYKNEAGNRIVFEEVNHRLGLVFAYAWTTGKRFGFIRSSQLINVGASEVRVRLLDGLRNLLPYGIDRTAQAEFSTLIQGAGFSIRRLTYANSFIFPIAATVRLGGRVGLLRDDPLWLAEPFGRVLLKLLGLEARWLRQRDLPIGLSLVCLAEA